MIRHMFSRKEKRQVITAGGTAWQTIGESQISTRHAVAGQPNQDAYGCGVTDCRDEWYLSVTDGHGDPVYSRSHIGAQLGSQAAELVADQYWAGNYCCELLPLQLENQWRQLVAEWHFKNPLTPTELAMRGSRDVYVLYGTTMLFAVKKGGHLVAVRFGDGDILGATWDGFVQPLFAIKDSSSDTYSLAHANSYLNAEITTRCMEHNALPLVFACSDGVVNGCASPAELMKIGEQLFVMLRMHGIKHVRKELSGLLKKANGTVGNCGSGDDASLALAYCGGVA